MTRSFVALGRGSAAARLSAFGRPMVASGVVALGRGFAAARLSAYGRPC